MLLLRDIGIQGLLLSTLPCPGLDCHVPRPSSGIDLPLLRVTALEAAEDIVAVRVEQILHQQGGSIVRGTDQ